MSGGVQISNSISYVSVLCCKFKYICGEQGIIWMTKINNSKLIIYINNCNRNIAFHKIVG